MLNARFIGEEAERAVLSLPLTRGDTFSSLYSYLTVDEPAVHEPAVHLMPLHFLPQSSAGQVGESVLHELAVAGNLEYARNRWLDEMVDDPGCALDLSSTHQLNEAVLALICARYASVLDARSAAAFFPMLPNVYSRYELSLILGSTWYRNPAASMALEGYTEHAKIRHGPVRAPVDAVLFLQGPQIAYSGGRDPPGTSGRSVCSPTTTPST